MVSEKIQSRIRPPAVAGMFYPDDRQQLQTAVQGFLSAAQSPNDQPVPKAIIAPHAGYPYSGPIAANVYALLKPAVNTINRIVMVGPAHRVAFTGLAVPDVDQFATPIGNVPVDHTALGQILNNPAVNVVNQAHAQEHCLEVHLPFLIELFGQTGGLANFSIVPILFGDCSHRLIATILETLWGGEETLILISSDLSHYHDYASAQSLDNAAKDAIENLSPHDLAAEQACGRTAIQGLLDVAPEFNLTPKTIDLRNSGDTAGPRDQVVGYGAWSFA